MIDKNLPKCACFEERNSPMTGVMVELAQMFGGYLTVRLSDTGLCRETWDAVLDMTVINALTIHASHGTIIEPGTPECQAEIKERVRAMSMRVLEKIDDWYEEARRVDMTNEKYQAMQQSRTEIKQ